MGQRIFGSWISCMGVLDIAIKLSLSRSNCYCLMYYSLFSEKDAEQIKLSSPMKGF